METKFDYKVAENKSEVQEVKDEFKAYLNLQKDYEKS